MNFDICKQMNFSSRHKKKVSADSEINFLNLFDILMHVNKKCVYEIQQYYL